MNEFKFDARKHCYTLNGKPLQGVTTVLGVINKPSLIQWAANMAVDYIEQNAETVKGITPYNEAEESVAKIFSDIMRGTIVVMPDVLKEARVAHRKKKEAAGSKGTDVHAEVEWLVKESINNRDGMACLGNNFVAAYSKQAQSFYKWALDNKVRFLESEKRMYSEKLWLAGTCDFTFEMNGKRYVGDLKTMAKMWDRVPFFQTAAYMMMLEEHGEQYDGSVIININKETAELTEHFSYDHESDKEAFLACLTLYRKLNQ